MTDYGPPYEVPDEELKWWERKVRRWTERHPAPAARFDALMDDDDAEMAIGMVTFAVLPLMALNLLSMLLWVIFGSHWGWVALSFSLALLFYCAATLFVWREDHRP